MNKYEEALVKLEYYNELKNVKNSISVIRELVEFRTPKEVIYDYMCPSCENICEIENQKYCDDCGQALKRSSKDE